MKVFLLLLLVAVATEQAPVHKRSKRTIGTLLAAVDGFTNAASAAAASGASGVSAVLDTGSDVLATGSSGVTSAVAAGSSAASSVVATGTDVVGSLGNLVTSVGSSIGSAISTTLTVVGVVAGVAIAKPLILLGLGKYKLFQYLRSSNAKEPAVAVAGLDHLQLNEEWTPVGEPYIVRLPAHAAPPLPAVPAVPASPTEGSDNQETDSDEDDIKSPSGFSREANHNRY